MRMKGRWMERVGEGPAEGSWVEGMRECGIVVVWVGTD
jgi:hypothetical protein